ncbi:MAG: tetratricopeptide repeat protein [bacterium]|nr:tetratricopeptide repeat protein [bacterium]
MLRVAIVQMDFNPACSFSDINFLEEPVYTQDPKDGISTLDLPGYTQEISTFRRKIRTSYEKMMENKIEYILSFCKEKKVEVLVFPEYSIPASSLRLLKGYANKGMCIVCGSHTALKENERYYRELNISPEEGRNISVCLLPNDNKIGWIEKLSPSPWEEGKLEIGDKWGLIKGKEISFLVFLSMDFINETNENRQRFVKNKHFYQANFVCVPSFMEDGSCFEKSVKRYMDENKYISGYKKVVLYTNISSAGGSQILFHFEEGTDISSSLEKDGSFQIPKGDEGILIMDLDVRIGTQFVKEKPVQVCVAPFVYEGILPGYKDFILEYQKEKALKDKRSVIERWEKEIFSWWKSETAPKTLIKKIENLLTDYYRLSEERLDFLLDNRVFPKEIPTLNEWRFVVIGETIEFLEGLALEVNPKDRLTVENRIRFYKRQQQVLKRKVREDYLHSFYLVKKREGKIQKEEEEAFIWAYKDFSKLPQVPSVTGKLLGRPILRPHEVERCFMTTRAIKQFIKGFKLRSYLFLSPSGTGKTSFLSYLSLQVLKNEYTPIWIKVSERLPSYNLLFEQLPKDKLVLFFDDIHKNRYIVDLLSEIKKRHPKLPIICTARPDGFLQLKEKWEIIKDKFQEENLPGYLEKEDVEEIISIFDLSKEERKIILSKGELPFIHLTILYVQKEVVKGLPEDPLRIFQAIYNSCSDEERFVLKFLTYLDFAKKEVLLEAMRHFGIEGHALDRLLKRDIIYFDSIKCSPDFTQTEVLTTFSDLKVVTEQHTFHYERIKVLPDIFLSTVKEREGIISLLKRYERFDYRQRDRYVELLREKKEDISVLWIISNLAKKRAELLEIADFALNCKRDANLSEILYNFGLGFTFQNMIDRAIECYEIALEISPNNPSILFNLGLAFGKKGEMEKERECFERALQISPNDPTIWFNLGISYGKKGDERHERMCFEKAIEISPNDPMICYKLGIFYERNKQMDKAIDHYEKAVNIDPTYHLPWFNLGIICQNKGELDRALICFKKALSYRLDDAMGWYYLGEIFKALNDTDRAIKCFAKAISLDTEYGDAWYSLGIAYRDKGKDALSLQCLERTTKIDLENAQAFHNLGIAYRDRKRLERALSCFEKATSLNPKDGTYWYNLGVTYRDKGKTKKAIECFEKAKTLRG